MRQPVPFGKYLLLDRISVGGMAEVFKAKSYGVEGFEKIIAIKRILPTMGEDRDFIKMFIDEAKIAGQLAHANICQIFELGRIDGSHFIAMEYIWGKDLLQIQNRLRKLKQPMPVPMACFVIAKVLEGLDYAHRKRDPLGRPLEIVHRDCSPQNVLVSYEGEVKVIDFGIAKATSRNSRTMAGVLKGKFGYMSPEQVRGLPLDRRSDIFAIGTMLYECLTSERLFQGETDFSTLEKVRNVDIPMPRQVNPAIPESVEKVILKALAKDVDNRYQWCSEMLQDLQQYLMTQDVVFTAKSLSSWLKEGFAGEIDKERALLEQYKRVGRDGLIAGLPAAEAKLDVVEHLGEAPKIDESDATQLGGPDFQDMEQGIGAAPEVGPAPGSPAARGGPRGKTQSDDDSSGDFGEEAPTEIFGEVDNPSGPPAAAPPARASTPSSPTKAPPKPPPGRMPTTPPPLRAPTASPLAAAPRIGGGGAVSDAALLATAQADDSLKVPAGGFGAAAQPPAPQHTPVPQFNPQAAPLPTGEQARTMLGQMAPAGLPNYSQGYPRAQTPSTGPTPAGPASGQVPAQGQFPQGYAFDPHTGRPLNPSGQMPAAYPQNTPSGQYYQQQPPQGYPYQNANDPYGQQSSGGYPQHGFANGSGQMGGTGITSMTATNGMPPAPAVEAKPEGRKKSSLGRDIAIGVVIAIVVLGGFLAVKFLVLDKKDPPKPATTTSQIATLKISLPGGATAQLFVDDKDIGAFADKSEALVNAGKHKLRLVRGDEKCERELTLEGGKSAVFDCVLLGGAGSAGSAAVPATGSAGSALAPGVGSASAGSAAGSGAGSGSAQVATNDKTVAKTDPPKVDPPKVDPPKVDPPKTDPKVVTTPKTDPKVVTTPKTDPKTDPKKDPRNDRLPFEDKKPVVVEKPSTDKGYLEVSANKKAKILVDGVDTGLSTPISGKTLSLTPGRHKITFVVGEDRFTFPVTITAGKVESMRKDSL